MGKSGIAHMFRAFKFQINKNLEAGENLMRQ